MSGGLVNDASVIAYKAHEAISDAGLLVRFSTTVNSAVTGATQSAIEFALCGAGEEPDGFTFTSTQDPTSTTASYLADVMCGVGALIPGIKVNMTVAAGNAAIAVGDKLETVASGKVDLKSGAGWVVGTALSAVEGSAAGYVTVLVGKYYASA